MLEGELDSNLDYEKNQRSKEDNSSHGYAQEKVRSSFGEDSIKVHRDREGSIYPTIVPKRQNMVDGIGNVIVSLYAKGMNNSDIEEQISEIYGFDASISTIQNHLWYQ